MKETKETPSFFLDHLNSAQIFEKRGKIIARTYNVTTRSMTNQTFEKFQHENLSQVLFSDKVKNLNGRPIYTAWMITDRALSYPGYGIGELNCRWTYFAEIVAEKLNTNVQFIQIPRNNTSWEALMSTEDKWVKKLSKNKTLDLCFGCSGRVHELKSYYNLDICLWVPIPPPFSITELILILPMDSNCWKWLMITIAVSSLVWKISEGHWSFPFGAFSYFMGQAQLSVRIRT